MKADLLNRFRDYAESRRLFRDNERVLAAVSGGSDSVALLDLLLRAGAVPVVAHCNFNLRGGESDSEEEFVANMAGALGLEYHVNHFDTENFASGKGISVQMAARELRYQWFESIRRGSGCQWIAVAHQADDHIETILINLIRGTGLRGMAGIREKQGFVIRPLLFASREEILQYLRYRGLPWREDSSNQDIHYTRNRVRHLLLKEILTINPGFRQVAFTHQTIFGQAQELVDDYINTLYSSLVTHEAGQVRIHIEALQNNPFKELLLFELLRPYGFLSRQVPGIIRSFDGLPGKQFDSDSHHLLKDREHLIIRKKELQDTGRYYLDPEVETAGLPIGISFNFFEKGQEPIPNDPLRAWLDYDRIDFPLILRKWEPGDYFHPLGMDQSKKLSDFFIDNKFSLFDKQRCWILATGEKIVWIVGHRIDHRFRITGSTRRILEVRASIDVASD
ncbi:MAG: tRNA lysidine(34) synthetase TilS [Bacteroidales bacterium]